MIGPGDTITIGGENCEVAWSAIPGSQELAVTCPCNEVLYDGSRGPGKTDAQLMRFRSLVGMGYGKHLRGVIFDREYKGLDDIISKSEKHFYNFGDGAVFKRAKSDYCWVWPTGEVLYFRQIKREADYQKVHGQELPWIGINELTKYPNRKIYDLLKSCNRSGFDPVLHTPKDEDGNYLTPDGKPLPPLPLQIFCTTNPWGPGHSWVKDEFVDGCDPGEVRTTVTSVFNPKTKQREDVIRTKVRIFGTYKENIYLDPVYIAGLENETDPERRKAWLLGDWNIRAGGMFNDIYKEYLHVIEDFPIPKDWRVDRAFDWGSSRPFSVGWYCVANGEAVTLNDGTRFAPKRGSIIRFAEWYGTSGGINEGLRMSDQEIASGIMDKEMSLLSRKVICDLPQDGPADPSIFNTRKDVDSTGEVMKKEGVGWLMADHSNGARKNGWQLIRNMLKNVVNNEGPGLYFTKSCRYARKFMPDTPRDEEDPDDVDTETEDHLQDELRYRVLDASRKMTGKIKTKYSK
jgi:hypothetical protein